MWSIVHDIVIAIGLGLHLVYRVLGGIVRGDRSIFEYAAYRRGAKIGELANDGRPLLWFHGVSVGEVAALDPVIAAVRVERPGVAIAVSTMTADGLRTIRKLANAPEIAFIYPIDLSFFARRIVARLRPRALVIVDGDFWFQMLRACRRAAVPVMVINGRLSERSTRRYFGVPAYARELFSNIALASVESKTMAERFARFIPASKITVDGNLKLDAAPATLTQAEGSDLRKQFAIDPARFCFVFGSIHPAEIASIAPAIRDALAAHPEVQIVVVPRHPAKFAAAPIDGVIWVDRMGVLRDLYQLADAAFVGGTFCEVGGHNLAEPVLVGKPVIYGPDVHKQIPLHEMLEAYEASMQVKTTEELSKAMLELMENRALRERMAGAGAKLRADAQGLAARIAARLLNAANVL